MNILQSTRNNTPNAVTCCNLLSGALACVAAFHAFEPWWWGLQGYQVAFVLIALAAVFDFFDGFTARLLHAVSPLGKELDSLSDAVSFGLAPGMVLYNMLVQYAPEGGVAYIAMLIPVFGALRLAKFNVSTDQSTTFTGLPIPANAIFWIGFTNFYAEHRSEEHTSELLHRAPRRCASAGGGRAGGGAFATDGVQLAHVLAQTPQPQRERKLQAISARAGICALCGLLRRNRLGMGNAFLHRALCRHQARLIGTDFATLHSL